MPKVNRRAFLKTGALVGLALLHPAPQPAGGFPLVFPWTYPEPPHRVFLPVIQEVTRVRSAQCPK